MRRIAVVLSACAGLGIAASLLVGAAVPEDKKEITLDLVPGKKGSVAFSHEAHVVSYKKMGDAAIVCRDCHHRLKADEPKEGEEVKGCPDCHVAVGEKAKIIEGKQAPPLAVEKKGKIKTKSVILHGRCLDNCHKKMKGEARLANAGKKIHTCKTCHPTSGADHDTAEDE